MASNYPPGVTGREYEIAGPDYEVDRTVECSACGRTLIQTVIGYQRQEWFECSGCGWHNEIDTTVDEEPDLEEGE